MAYIDQTKKSEIAPTIKAILKRYGMKGTLSIRNHSVLCLTITSGKLNPFDNFNKLASKSGRGDVTRNCEMSVNPYHFQNQFDGEVLNFLKEIFAVMNNGNHDRSDIQTDYFDVGWYVDVDFGKWNKPYVQG
jgi:hypothetical protein